MPAPRADRVDPFAAGVVAAIGMVVLATALVPLRTWMGNTNVALVLVVGIVAAAALGGRAAGVSAAVAAAVAYNFFHTRPHYTLLVHDRFDRITTLLLLAVGLLSGEIVVRAQRARTVAATQADELVRLRRAAHVGSATTPEHLIPLLEEEIGAVLGLWFCRYQPGPPEHPMARLTRQGVTLPADLPPVTSDPNTWALDLPVVVHGREVGRFVLVPHEPNPAGVSDPAARRDAVALADQLAAALAATPPDA